MKPPFHKSGTVGFFNDRNEWQCTGAAMGRRDAVPDDAGTVRKLRLQRVRPVDHDYDKGGAYWGALEDRPLFCAWGESDTEQAITYVRAFDRKNAKAQILAKFPNAKFFN